VKVKRLKCRSNTKRLFYPLNSDGCTFFYSLAAILFFHSYQ